MGNNFQYNGSKDNDREDNMAELKIICEYPDTLKKLIEEEVARRLRSLEDGIRRTEERIKEFESKYQMSTEEFLRRYENDEIQETLEIDEWIGESLMLKGLQEDLDTFKGIEFVN
ncbi:hypothetical protein [Argonema antarcticum]|uniref:hypothetical protein n=1 Tax=Argonema antarcticum TaxID=2942763 RepID=UPI002012C58F|nr:hypothetical protein [Argonema antarcticum]MCL1470015.1 hypothetical protein [Argonema antarcticum A004/B2]